MKAPACLACCLHCLAGRFNISCSNHSSISIAPKKNWMMVFPTSADTSSVSIQLSFVIPSPSFSFALFFNFHSFLCFFLLHSTFFPLSFLFFSLLFVHPIYIYHSFISPVRFNDRARHVKPYPVFRRIFFVLHWQYMFVPQYYSNC